MYSQFEKASDRDILLSLFEEVVGMKKLIHSIPNWISAADIGNYVGLSSDSIRNRVVYSGDYECGVDYKFVGTKKLVIHKSVLHTLKRLRKAKGVAK